MRACRCTYTDGHALLRHDSIARDSYAVHTLDTFLPAAAQTAEKERLAEEAELSIEQVQNWWVR